MIQWIWNWFTQPLSPTEYDQRIDDKIRRWHEAVDHAYEDYFSNEQKSVLALHYAIKLSTDNELERIGNWMNPIQRQKFIAMTGDAPYVSRTTWQKLRKQIWIGGE